MRRTVILGLIILTVATPFLVAARGAPPEPKAPRQCTIRGGPGDNVKTGTSRGDVICTFAGDDYLHGAAGDDRLRAGRNTDTAVGGGGRDLIRGGKGNDRLFGVDDRGGDRLVGGRGRDQCFADRGDLVFGCEATFRGLSLEVVRALSRTTFDLMVIADDALSSITPTIPPPPVVVTVTETRTVTAVFPPCTPPPNAPPAPCP